ncbi:phosphoglycerate dehydrogenase [Kocuria dechangensis]|uniref:phosphoglycerate dehydrogenase n=1 Tax=Kocuria dechangensis TaxID=1176249 RepID=UPI001E5EF204|nr:phosphoglycerate dehydrogenase [Kocuria dechangensis]
MVTTPSFGLYSDAPWQAIEAEQLDVRRSRAKGPLSPAQLREEVTEAVALIVGVDRVDASVLAAAPHLKVIGKHGVGIDNIDLQAAAEAGVTVVRTPGANSRAVADLAVTLLLAGARKLLEADRTLRAGAWNQLFGQEMHGRTLGLIGFGQIGREVARRGAGFGCEITAYDPFLPEEVFARDGVRRCSLPELLATSDFISLHVPMPPDGSPLLSREALETMKPGAGVVNTSRGGLIDSAAAADLLRSGHLGFLAADAFEEEPIPPDHPLLSAPNTVLTPHIGACSDGANAAMGSDVIHDVARVLRGEPPHHPVSPDPSTTTQTRH